MASAESLYFLNTFWFGIPSFPSYWWKLILKPELHFLGLKGCRSEWITASPRNRSFRRVRVFFHFWVSRYSSLLAYELQVRESWGKRTNKCRSFDLSLVEKAVPERPRFPSVKAWCTWLRGISCVDDPDWLTINMQKVFFLGVNNYSMGAFDMRW